MQYHNKVDVLEIKKYLCPEYVPQFMDTIFKCKRKVHSIETCISPMVIKSILGIVNLLELMIYDNIFLHLNI